MDSPTKLKTKSSGRLRKRKISKPRKRIDVSERDEPEVESSGGEPQPNQYTLRTNEADASHVSGLPWLSQAKALEVAGVLEDAPRGRDQANVDESGSQGLVTPKKENLLQGYIEDEWVELGPSVHRDGHSPTNLDKEFGQNLSLKSSPDSYKENGALEKNVGSVTRQLDLDLPKNEVANISEEEMAAGKVKDQRSSSTGGSKFDQYLQNESSQAEVGRSGQNLVTGKLGTQSFSLHCSGPGHAVYAPWPRDHLESNVSSAVTPVMYVCKDGYQNGPEGHGFQGPYVSSQAEPAKPNAIKWKRKKSKPLIGALMCPDPILALKANKFEGQNVVFLAQYPHCVAEMPPLESPRPEAVSLLSSGRANVLSWKKAKCAGRNAAGVAPAATPKMSRGHDFVDPTKIKFGLDDDVTDDELVKIGGKGDQNSSDEEWRPYRVNVNVKTAQNSSCLPVGQLQSENEEMKKKSRRRRRVDKSVNQSVDCPTCGKHFRGKYHLRRHELSHSEDRPYACQICTKSFKQKAHLHGHMAVHKYTQLEPENAVIKQIDKVQPIKSIGRPRKIYAENELSCKNCGKSFKTAYRLRRHEQSHTDIRPFICKICGKGFKQTGHRNEHEANHEKENKKSYLCNMCGVVFRCRSSFNTHMRSHNVEKARLVYCKTNDEGEEMIKQEFQEITHTGYDCPYCPDKFATAQALNNHLETHVEVKHRRHVQPYSCDICKRTFTYRHNLIKHKLVHKAPEKFAQFYKDKIDAHVASGKPSYRCIVCSKVFIRKETLSKHQKIHLGKKPFKCSICSAEFTQNVHLKVHMRKHTGSRPFQCKECNKGFIDSTALAKHIEYEACNSENALYRCKVCGKRLYYLGSIKQHIRKQHGITQEEGVEMHILKFERMNKRRNCGDSDKLVCKICFRYFTEKCNLVRHVRKKHSELIDLLSADKNPYCLNQSVDLQAANKIESLSENETTVGDEKLEVNTPGELVIDECRGEDRTFVSRLDIHRDSVQIHDSDRTPPRAPLDGHGHMGYVAIKEELKTDSETSDKLLEGFNTAGFDCLNETATAIGARDDAFLSRAQAARQGFVSPGIANGDQDNRDASLLSDINFLYNIGLIVSSKNQKYSVGIQSDYSHDEKQSICSGAKRLRQEDVIEMSVENRTSESALSRNTFAKEEMTNKPCLNHCVPEIQNWDFFSQRSSQENCFTLMNRDNGLDFIKREPESLPMASSECIGNTAVKLEYESDFLREASTKPLKDSPAKIIVKDGDGNERRPPPQATKSPYSAFTAEGSIGCGVASADPMGKLQESLQGLEFKQMTSELATEEMCIDFLEAENVILKEEVSGADYRDRSVSPYRNGAKKCRINLFDVHDTSGNGGTTSLSPCSSPSSESSVTRGKQKAPGPSPMIKQMKFLSPERMTPLASPDDYESCPTESQLKCLGLLACRDSREVVSKKCSMDQLYSAFKPWLLELVSNARPRRPHEKRLPLQPWPSPHRETTDGVSGNSDQTELKDENCHGELVGDEKVKAAGEMISESKIIEMGSVVFQQGCSQFTPVENSNPATQQVQDLNTSPDFGIDMSESTPPLAVDRTDSMSYASTGSPSSSVGSRSGHSGTCSYASPTVTDTASPTRTTDTSTPRCKGSFSCSVCAKVFSARHQLKRHELTHTDHRPYNCDKCGRAFRQKVHLSDHTKRHQGERPFACESCGKRFVLKNEMNQHMKHHCKVATAMIIRSSLGKNKNHVLTLALSQRRPVFLGGTAPTSSAAANGMAQDYNVTFLADKASRALFTAEVDDANRAADANNAAREMMPSSFNL